MNRIDKLQDDLGKCKTENEELIMDLRECKTRMAFLEEKKAMLQIDLDRERKRNTKRGLAKEVSADSMNNVDEEKNLPVTVHHKQANILGCFPAFVGKSCTQPRVQPPLHQSQPNPFDAYKRKIEDKSNDFMHAQRKGTDPDSGEKRLNQTHV